jgi:hypothetical protein
VDLFNQQHFAQGANMLTHTGASDVIDNYFADPDYARKLPPSQKYPPLLLQFLASNEVARRPTFLWADAIVRNFCSEGRQQMQDLLEKLLPTLKEHPYRWALLAGVGTFATMMWLQRSGHVDSAGVLQAKAEAALLGLGQQTCEVLVVYVDDDGNLAGGRTLQVKAPGQDHIAYVQRLEDGRKMMERSISLQ